MPSVAVGIGDVMKESAQAALSYVKSHLPELGLETDVVKDHDLHVHVPAGAIPKDGPSAGVAMIAALSSLLSQRCVRPDVAMTGEITLRGLVLPVGGIKEKMLAAHRAGIKRIVLPERNEKDVVDVPEEIRDEMDIVYVKTVGDVLGAVFTDEPPVVAGEGSSRAEGESASGEASEAPGDGTASPSVADEASPA